jgi:hypothetical protein
MSRLSRRVDIWLPIVIGTVAFIFLTGGRIIFPSNISWLMIGDSAQHYTSWQFFRHTPILQWPLGASPKLGLDYSNSIVYTDSIPIAAFIFKLLNPILPSTFQYFGFWIWSCFVLQSYFGWKLLSNFIKSKLYLVAGSIFFTISPVFLYRLIHDGYGHIALASQWLVIAALHLYFRDHFELKKWVTLVVLASLIQAYFIPMILAILVATIIKFLLARSISIVKSLSAVATSVTACLISLWLSGYFMFAIDRKGMESWNYILRWQPLSLVDSGSGYSEGWSRILADRQQLPGDEEGFSYLGSGIIALAITILLIKLIQIYKSPDDRTKKIAATTFLCIYFVTQAVLADTGTPYSDLFSKSTAAATCLLVAYLVLRDLFQGDNLSPLWRQRGPLAAAVLLLATYSMTNRVGVGMQTLFSYPITGPVKYVFEIFRSHGRFIWPLYYLVLLVVLVEVTKRITPKLVVIVLSLAIGFQFFDSHEAHLGVRSRFSDAEHWTSPMKDPIWNEFAIAYKSVMVVPPLNNDRAGRWLAITDYAGSNRMATNSGNFSRLDGRKFIESSDRLLEDVRNGKFASDSLYIIEDQQLWASLPPLPDVRFAGELDGYKVIAP